MIEVVLRALADPMLRALVFEAGQPMRPEDERTYASDLLRKLKEHAWLEDYRDPIDLKPTLKLSRAGKAFSETFADLDDSRTKTRQRNMRSARKALAAFIATRDGDELLDAHEFAGRVVQDLQDDIEYFRSTDPEPDARGPGAEDCVERVQRVHREALRARVRGAPCGRLGRTSWKAFPWRTRPQACRR